ncbi:hypothetical protein ANN_06333 [Periplaneta americana]|uniref:Uncharacterized protein n=1 Tax=Periplaneta americana TaxID=6978 RepID=A0ABQ8TD95_PERAM|nr:hypothetical protein ANN_06333 [Periplaneta americana]
MSESNEILSDFDNIDNQDLDPNYQISEDVLLLPQQDTQEGYLKSKVYVNRLQRTDDLKIAISQKIANIHGKMLERATRNFRERLEECIERQTPFEGQFSRQFK